MFAIEQLEIVEEIVGSKNVEEEGNRFAIMVGAYLNWHGNGRRVGGVRNKSKNGRF